MSRTISFVNRVGTFNEVAKIIRYLKLFVNVDDEISVELPLFIKVNKKRSVEIGKKADKLLNSPVSFNPNANEYDEACLLYGRLVDVHNGTFYLGIYFERLYELIRLEQIKVMYLRDEDKEYLINGFFRTDLSEDRIAIENAYPISYKDLYKKEKIKPVDYQAPNGIDRKESFVLVDQVVSEEEVFYRIFTENTIPLVIEVDADVYETMKERREVILSKGADARTYFQEVAVLYSKEIQRYKNKCYVALSLKYLQKMLERRNKAVFYMLREGRECFIQDVKITDEFNHQKIMLFDEDPVTMRELCESIVYKYLSEEPVQKMKTPRTN